MAYEITLDDLTNINDKGAFDVISAAIKKELQDEFAAGRINATEYSKIFSTGLDTSLSQALQFLLQKDAAAQQAALIQAQVQLTLAQKKIADANILLTNKQIEKLDREIELMDDQQLLIQKQALLIDSQIEKIDAEVLILGVEKNKLTQEVSLVTAQTQLTEANVLTVNTQRINIPKEGKLLDQQVTKAESETSLLDQRVKTEIAQILDAVDGVNVAGVLGKQKNLYQAQADGFVRDAELKVTKMLVDTWSVRRSTDATTLADTVNKLDNPNIGAAVAKCLTGINVTVI